MARRDTQTNQGNQKKETTTDIYPIRTTGDTKKETQNGKNRGGTRKHVRRWRKTETNKTNKEGATKNTENNLGRNISTKEKGKNKKKSPQPKGPPTETDEQETKDTTRKTKGKIPKRNKTSTTKTSTSTKQAKNRQNTNAKTIPKDTGTKKQKEN